MGDFVECIALVFYTAFAFFICALGVIMTIVAPELLYKVFGGLIALGGGLILRVLWVDHA